MRVRSANPVRGVVQYAEPIGPRTFAEEAFVRLQQFVDDADAAGQRALASGRLQLTENFDYGNFIDRAAMRDFRGWLRSMNIQEGSGQMVEVNRWLRDPTGSGLFTRPDVRVPGANLIMDVTVSPLKLPPLPDVTSATRQVQGFFYFSQGDHILVVRPTRLGGSYGLVFP